MTDNEIIKALENEIHLAEYVDSDYCNSTEVSLIKSTLDLINRQRAEIKHLDDESDALRADICFLEEQLKTAKVEAYKEFAEGLKEMSEHFDLEKENFVSEEAIDNLLKEKVGDGNVD